MTRILSRATQLFRLSLPLAAMEVPVAATVAIDTVLLGRLGAGAIAAGGLGAAVFLFVTSIGVSVISSVGHEAAYRSGRRDRRGVLGILYGGVALACLLGVVAALALIAAVPLLRMLGVDPAVGRDAAFYLYGVAPGVPFLLLAVCYRGIVSVQPDPTRLAGVAAAAVATKAVLAALGYAWLAHGAPSPHTARGGLLICGITTTLTFVAMGAAAWRAHRRSLPDAAPSASPDATVQGARRIFRRGLTIGLTTALQTGFFSLVAVLCGQCSPADLAAHQVANQCTLLPLMLAFGMSQAVATLTSGALGAQSPREAGRMGWDAVGFGIAAMFVVALALLVLGHAAVAAILPAGTPDREQVAALAWRLIVVGALCMLADGAQNVAMGALRGLSLGRLTIHSAIVGYWCVGIPLAWWLGDACGLGATGVWIGVGVGLHVSAAMLLYFLYRATRAPAIAPRAAHGTTLSH